jgi:glutaredoxin 3
VLTQARVGGEGLDRGHGEQIAAALIEHEVEAEERFEAAPEARARLANPFGNRAQSAPIRGIQMEDPVRFAVSDRAEDDSFRLHRSGYRTILSEVMSQITVYTTEPCGYCRVAKALLDKRGVVYEEKNLAKDPDGRAELVRLTGMMTFPQVVIDGASIGGYQELVAFDKSGGLKELAAAA